MIDKWNKLVSITVEQSMHKTKMSSIAIVDSTSQTHTVLVSLNDFDLIDVVFSWSFSWTLKKGPKIG